jgi:hypothetical protein
MPAPNDTVIALTRQARAEFGVATFWSIPCLANPADEARNVGRQLAKHGGMAARRACALPLRLNDRLGHPQCRDDPAMNQNAG